MEYTGVIALHLLQSAYAGDKVVMISFSRKPDKVKSYDQVDDCPKAKLALATLLFRMPGRDSNSSIDSPFRIFSAKFTRWDGL